VNIITDSGIRLGVNEVTRWGMKENEMQRIAEFIYKVYKREDKSRIKEEVIKLKNDFETIEYRFKDIDPFEFIQSFF
jgi:Glycine/serine hydroxymethyltransferase